MIDTYKTNKCPNCSAPIKQNALKCEYCESFFVKESEELQEIYVFGGRGNQRLFTWSYTKTNT